MFDEACWVIREEWKGPSLLLMNSFLLCLIAPRNFNISISTELPAWLCAALEPFEIFFMHACLVKEFIVQLGRQQGCCHLLRCLGSNHYPQKLPNKCLLKWRQAGLMFFYAMRLVFHTLSSEWVKNTLGRRLLCHELLTTVAPVYWALCKILYIHLICKAIPWGRYYFYPHSLIRKRGPGDATSKWLSYYLNLDLSKSKDL